MNQELLALGNDFLKAQPFSVLLGATLQKVDIGIIEIALEAKEAFNQNNGFVHGGVISYLADNAMTFAGGSVLGANVLTAEYKINYLKPATDGLLVAKARVISSGKKLAICQCSVIQQQDQENLIALAQGTIMATDGEGTEDRS